MVYRLRSLTIAAFLIALFFATTAPAAPLKVGMAETDITPPEGFPMAGYYHERRATGTHDPLKAKAIVFDDGSTSAALVVCDVTGIAIDLSTEVRRLAEAATGIPAANISIAATHSHTAPDYSKDLYDFLAAQKAGQQEEEKRYAATLIERIVEAIRQAHAARQPATIDAGSAIQEEPISFNRRFVMKDGSVRTWQRLDGTGVLRAAGPIDPEVGILQVRSADQSRVVGVLSNFALHLDTVGGTSWSGDYPFYVEQVLRKTLDPNVVSIFGTGCCGDINHVDPVGKDRNKTDQIGLSLAKTVQDGLKKVQRLESPTLRSLRATVPVPLQKITTEQVAKSQPLVAEARAGKQIEFFSLVTAYKTLILEQLHKREPTAGSRELLSWGLTHHWAGVGDTLPVDVHVIAIGDGVAIVCLPGEVFVNLGLAIKQASPFRTTLLIELSNCVETIYVPHRAAYAGGSYEVTNSNLEPGGGEMIVESAVRLLREAASRSHGG